MGRIKQVLRRNGMRGIWENYGNHNKKVCIRKRKKCVAIENVNTSTERKVH
jgi:hypothetical protein